MKGDEQERAGEAVCGAGGMDRTDDGSMDRWSEIACCSGGRVRRKGEQTRRAPP